MEGKLEKKEYKKIIFLMVGALVMLSAFLVSQKKAYAAEVESKTIQGVSPGNEEPAQGKGQVDVDGTVKKGKASSGSVSSASSASKPSTTQVGNGLNDKLTQNAKTGDVNRNVLFLTLLIASMLCLAVILKRKTARSKQ